MYKSIKTSMTAVTQGPHGQWFVRVPDHDKNTVGITAHLALFS